MDANCARDVEMELDVVVVFVFLANPGWYALVMTDAAEIKALA